MAQHDIDTSITRPDLKGLHILLVEDDEINQMIIRNLLENAGAKISVACNGMEAVQITLQARFDGVLMDVKMPVMDGVMATQKIREVHPVEVLPIIAMTANATEGDREQYHAAGMNDCIAKPVHAGELYDVLVRYVRRDGLADGQSQLVFARHTAGSQAHFDPDAALARVGNRDDLASMLGIFVQSYGQAAGSIGSALDRSDWKLAERLVHTLKGAAASIGAPVLSGLAAQLEAAIPGKETGVCFPTLDNISSELSRVIILIRTYLESDAPGTGK